MSELKKQTKAVFESLCKENNISEDFVSGIFRQANRSVYESNLDSERAAEYKKLIEFYIKIEKGGEQNDF